MLTPYRFSPPTAASRISRPPVERPRLIELLDARFERRLTFVQGGAGFGKTTLLSQAISENLESPAGIDIWLGCTPHDERQREFAQGLRSALSVQVSEGDDLERIVNAIWRMSPDDVALMIDDVHHLGAEGSGAQFLERLVGALPANGHLVLASREPPRFPIARLVATHDAIVIDESKLAFDASEEALALGATPDLGEAADWGGWPALVELARTIGGGGPRPSDYVWEEVLQRIEPSRARALCRLSRLDWIDQERIEAISPRPFTVSELSEGLPLVAHSGDGSIRLHALWAPILHRIDPEWTPATFDRAVSHLADGGHLCEAVEFCLAFNAPDKIPDVIRGVTMGLQWTRLEPSELEKVLGLLPGEFRAAPTGQLLEGVFRVLTDPATSLPFLLAARTGGAAEGDDRVQVSAISALSFLAFFAVDLEATRALGQALASLDHPAIDAFQKLGVSMELTLGSKPDEALAMIESIRANGVDLATQESTLAAVAALDAGRPERALAEVDAAIDISPVVSRASLVNSRNEALWLLGRVDERALSVFDEGLVGADAGHTHNSTTSHAALAFQNAASGRPDAARTHLGIAESLYEPELGARAEMAVATARMALAALEGDEQRAREVIASSLSSHPPETRIHRHTLRATAIAWVLAPELRDVLSEARLGPCYQRALRAARALVALRDEGCGDEAAELEWAEFARFRCFFVPRMNLELALGAAASGNRRAEEIARELAMRDRETLRELASGEARATRPSPLGDVARRLLDSVPARPDGTLELRVLGPLELRREGNVVEHPDLRRSRVRGLLQLLVAKRSLRRSEIFELLWNDLDEPAAGNNLRVNLSHLIRVLEPNRAPNEPSFFIESDGEAIRLRQSDALEIDSERFEALLERAERLEAAGRLSDALEALDAAIALYRGDFLFDETDGLDTDSIAFERRRLRSSLVTAALRAGGLYAGMSEFRRALDCANRVLEIDELQEPAHRLCALVYLRQGDKNAARATLEVAARTLRAAEIDPSSELERLLQRVGGEGA